MKKDVLKNKTSKEIILFNIRLIGLILVIIFALLQLLGVWDKAIYVSAPLMGLVLLIQSIQEWKTSRSSAIVELICSLFIFICTLVAIFSLVTSL